MRYPPGDACLLASRGPSLAEVSNLLAVLVKNPRANNTTIPFDLSRVLSLMSVYTKSYYSHRLERFPERNYQPINLLKRFGPFS